MKQKLFFCLFLYAGMHLHPCMVVYGQTASSSCLYALDADLQKICLTPDTLAEPTARMSELLHQLAVEVSIPTVEGMDLSGSHTIIRFIVDESGQITGKLVLKRQFKDCDVADQMFQIVESMAWQPGYCEGEPVPTEFILPLRMCLN